MSGTLVNNSDLDDIFGRSSDHPNDVQVHIKVDTSSVVYCDGVQIFELTTGSPKIFHLPVGKHFFVFSSKEKPDVTVEIEKEFVEAGAREVVEVNNLKSLVDKARKKEKTTLRLKQLRPIFLILAIVSLLIAVAIFIFTRPRLKIVNQNIQIELPAAAGSTIYDIQANRDFSCTSNEDWLETECNGTKLCVKYSDNSSGAKREAIVTFSYAGKQKSFSFLQWNLCSILSVEHQALSIPPSSGRQYVSYETDAKEIQVSCDKDWCNVTVQEGRLLISWEENVEQIKRIAKIKIFADNIDRYIDVQQGIDFFKKYIDVRDGGHWIKTCYNDSIRDLMNTELIPEVNNGSADAAYVLYIIYIDGVGVPENTAEAIKWLRLSAEKGFAIAQNTLGNYCYSGEGIQKNINEAVKWYKLAAEQGNDDAQANLADCYLSGDGVEQNYDKALNLFRLSAEQGNAVAQNEMGNIYYNGNGVKRDLKEAFKWFLISAEQGNAVAQSSVGNCYLNGLGVGKNLEEAAKWYKLASDQEEINALLIYGGMLFYGTGVEKDCRKGAQLIKKSADMGNEDAINATRDPEVSKFL